MGNQLSFFVDDDELLITEEKVAQVNEKYKDEKATHEEYLNPFIEANLRFFGISSGEQLELDFLNILTIQEEESMNLKDVVKKLEASRKYTLLMIDDLTGFPYAVHLTLVSASIEQYAQHSEALYFTYRAKHRRSDSLLVFLPNKSFVIWEGHIDVDTNMWGAAKQVSPQITVARSKYGKFDKRYIDNGVESSGQEPYVSYRPANAIA
ncbi:hypothetical protein [Paenibacillus periandrae]|uniref:hypothetical protein n=1 Tax=Paenibacillus periandrae TaxID=1761741 RepID=UPI001F09CE20|nr:hypothetical protein [Paenibacillus periandrae]